jgi:hypothetical protein
MRLLPSSNLPPPPARSACNAAPQWPRPFTRHHSQFGDASTIPISPLLTPRRRSQGHGKDRQPVESEGSVDVGSVMASRSKVMATSLVVTSPRISLRSFVATSAACIQPSTGARSRSSLHGCCSSRRPICSLPRPMLCLPVSRVVPAATINPFWMPYPRRRDPSVLDRDVVDELSTTSLIACAGQVGPCFT